MEDVLIKDSIRVRVSDPRMDDDGNGRFTVVIKYDCKLSPDAYIANENKIKRICLLLDDDWGKSLIPPEIYSRRIGISPTNVYSRIRNGKLHAVRIAGKIYIVGCDLADSEIKRR